MIAVSRLFSILHVSIVIPFRWLAGNTHKLAQHKWVARSMGRAVDILHTACGQLLDDIKKIHDKKFMMKSLRRHCKRNPRVQGVPDI